MAYYSIEEIKIAALDTMMENSTLSITGMPFLAAMLTKLTAPKPTEAVPAPVVAEAEPEVTEPAVSEAAKETAPSAPVFLGPQAALKRSVYDRLQIYRTKGMPSVEISKLTKGKVTPDEVLEILAGAKMPFGKLEVLDNVLEGKQEEVAS